MSRLKDLSIKSSLSRVNVVCPYSDSELETMKIDYEDLSSKGFGKKYRHLIFRPSYINIRSETLEIQMNHCINPFCSNFGQSQEKYLGIRNLPSRYKISNATNKESGSTKYLFCNNSRNNQDFTMNCNTDTVSNWSVAEEIKRLIDINSISEKNHIYNFDKEGCSNSQSTPFEDTNQFYKRGKSTGNSQKFQCKICSKITNVLPETRKNFSYNQKKNVILPLFAKLLVSRTPVKNTCEILSIGSKTYYHKLEWLYKKCLEFLAKHETEAFKNKTFNEIWLNTDKMVYYLNNVRKKGTNHLDYKIDEDESKFLTYLVASSDLYSRYVFRADLAYDFTVTQEQIELDTKSYFEDHMYNFARKNDRLKYPYAPQPPTINDEQTELDYMKELYDFNKRKNYVDGVHVGAKYTSIAHYWLINKMIKSNKWNFISDEDNSIINSILRVFFHTIKDKKSHYFICKVNSELTLQESYRLHMEALRKIKPYSNDENNKHELLEIKKKFNTFIFFKTYFIK